MFVPRSWWKEVVADTACFGINFVLKGTTWAGGLTTALADLLLGDEDARAFCFGSFTGVPALEQAAVRRFEAVRARAARVLADLTLDEVYFGGKAATFQWSAAAADRTIVDNALVVPGISADPMPLDGVLVTLLAKLVALREPFRWEHLVVLCHDEIRGDVGASGLWNVLADLAESGYLERLPTRPT
jgi:hypothetical protein